MSDPASAAAAGKIGETAVDVGRVFGSGGTDGLILYALILSTFLMFLAAVAFALLLRRTLASLDNQAKVYADAGNKTATALQELASSIAAQTAGNQAHQLAVSNTLGRVELRLSHEEPGR